jgi:hypothetical protein
LNCRIWASNVEECRHGSVGATSAKTGLSLLSTMAPRWLQNGKIFGDGFNSVHLFTSFFPYTLHSSIAYSSRIHTILIHNADVTDMTRTRITEVQNDRNTPLPLDHSSELIKQFWNFLITKQWQLCHRHHYKSPRICITNLTNLYLPPPWR